MIIVISGKQYCGKDTVAKILLEKLAPPAGAIGTTRPNFTRVGIGDAIKLEYGVRTGLSFEQIEAQKHLYRDDLIKLGNEGRAKDPDFWLKKLLEMDNIIVPDIRVEHEAEMFRAQGAFLLRVEATREARESRGVITNENDNTETALDNYGHWNYVLDNSGDYETLKKACEPLVSLVSSLL